MADRSTASEETIGTLTAGTPALNDLIHFYRSNSDFKATMQQFAKFVLEDYAGSTLAGSARSAKSALDLLNSKTNVQIGPDNCDLNDFTETAWYCFDRLTANVANAPADIGMYFSVFLHVVKFNNNKILQEVMFSGSPVVVYSRVRWNRTTEWSAWARQATRNEIIPFLKLTYNGTTGRFEPPAGTQKLADAQLTFIVRNVQSGALYAIYYVYTDNVFSIASIISGNAPSNGNVVFISGVR